MNIKNLECRCLLMSTGAHNASTRMNIPPSPPPKIAGGDQFWGAGVIHV